MTPPAVSRRSFSLTALGALAAAGLGLGCRDDERLDVQCADAGELSPADADARAKSAYVDRSPDPLKACDRCDQFVASNAGCAGCKAVRGPVHPKGSCGLFKLRL